MVYKNNKKMTDILAVVLNWNDTTATEKCIKSLLEQKEISCDIIIIDNGSDENPESHLKLLFERIKVIRTCSGFRRRFWRFTRASA